MSCAKTFTLFNKKRENNIEESSIKNKKINIVCEKKTEWKKKKRHEAEKIKKEEAIKELYSKYKLNEYNTLKNLLKEIKK